ncbi:MAG: CRISPR system precrRNA processing endoribonuclease RAMP protein Cas6 [Thermodesulfovibrio sp.]|nr:CRISPR system precrRNA processing endoribonuclease RAMP protein Cas6 [Thermodesulfovibrio sp.]MDW7998104.1 CRISPR system precrRNA processing endoribonuclease RAMP protein Cas6 [Thermodesulfovibrio sp.]
MIINYQKFKFIMEAIEEIHLPYYKGSAFRGGFGNVFRKITCILKKQDCTECLLKSRCIYAYVFETFPSSSAQIMNMQKYEKIPHPFVIEPPEINSKNSDSKIYQPGSKFEFHLILIGKAIDYLPYFIYTFHELGKTGIGKGRGRYKILEIIKCKKDDGEWINEVSIFSHTKKMIKQTQSDTIYIPEEFNISHSKYNLSLRFVTPLRIKYMRDLVTMPEFHILIRNLLRRLLLLYYFHCEGREPQWNHKEIINHAESVVIESSKLKWFDWERYSSRQDTRMKLGGLMGSITYYGNIESFLPFIQAGEILHIGKNTSFGLGKYLIDRRNLN